MGRCSTRHNYQLSEEFNTKHSFVDARGESQSTYVQDYPRTILSIEPGKYFGPLSNAALPQILMLKLDSYVYWLPYHIYDISTSKSVRPPPSN